MRAPRAKFASVSAVLVVLLLALGPISVLRVVPAAHAQSTTTISITTSNGATVCPSSLNGAWDIAKTSDTCTITAVASFSLSGEDWALIGELLDFLFGMILDPNVALYISQGTTLKVGQGVTISAASDGFAIVNTGTINNDGYIIGVGGEDGGLANNGTINNNGWLEGDATNLGIVNNGVINDYGQEVLGYSDLYGIINTGTINNIGVLEGDGGSMFVDDTATTGQGIYNYGGHINNIGLVKGTSSWGGVPECSGADCPAPPYGLNNGGAIDNYCGEPLMYSSYGGTPPSSIPCTTVTFDVLGPEFFADFYSFPVTVSWGPFVFPWGADVIGWIWGYPGSGVGTLIFQESAPEPLNYSFPSHISNPSTGATYVCQSGSAANSIAPGAVTILGAVPIPCSGTVANQGTFVVTYLPALAPPTISAPPAIDAGQSATLSTTSSFSGGTPPFTCQWLESVPWGFSDLGGSFSCSPGDTPSEPTGALAAGSYSFGLQVTDSSSPAQVVTSDLVTVTVNPSPPAGVPQFPLGLALLFALLVPALLVLKKRAVSPSPRV
jgi:hypothetical protein